MSNEIFAALLDIGHINPILGFLSTCPINLGIVFVDTKQSVFKSNTYSAFVFSKPLLTFFINPKFASFLYTSILSGCFLFKFSMQLHVN